MLGKLHNEILKIREIFCENPRITFILFYDVHKENMFRTNLEDGREAPSKASNIKQTKNVRQGKSIAVVYTLCTY